MPPAHLMRKRDKPLRTYGRKCTSTAAPEPRDEPPAKRARSGSPEGQRRAPTTKLVVLIPAAPDPIFERDTLSFLEGEGREAEEEEEEEEEEDEASRSCILRYFRRLPVEARPQSQRQQKHNQRSAGKEPDAALPPVTNTSDITPCAREHTRKPRLLKIKGPSLRPEIWSEEPSSLANGDTDGADSTTASSPDHNDRATRTALLPSDTRSRSSSRSRSEEIFLRKKRHKDHRSKRLPFVQTTLNISSQAAFAECKVCDTVWNPLYPDDVKYHDKRHRALLRRERKREAEKL
ncbi:hypothetical protein E4U55_007478 [Claviceps digitariae]|nr:hypothetical protein E4U55_007478 [Claviceps digitariae]